MSDVFEARVVISSHCISVFQNLRCCLAKDDKDLFSLFPSDGSSFTGWELQREYFILKQRRTFLTELSAGRISCPDRW